MKKAQKITAAIASVVIGFTMTCTAFAASTTSSDVLKAAVADGVPAKYVTELKNYLDANASDFKSADFDYMISSMSNTYTKYLLPQVEKMYGEGTKIADITDAQLVAAFKALSQSSKDAIVSAAQATAKHFGIELTAEKLDNGQYSLTVNKKGNAVVGGNTDNKPLSTGSTSVSSVEALAAIIMCLTGAGIFVIAKNNKKVEM